MANLLIPNSVTSLAPDGMTYFIATLCIVLLVLMVVLEVVLEVELGMVLEVVLL
mgnify:CR=1 FL=1